MKTYKFVKKGTGTPTGKRLRLVKKTKPSRRISPKRLA